MKKHRNKILEVTQYDNDSVERSGDCKRQQLIIINEKLWTISIEQSQGDDTEAIT